MGNGEIYLRVISPEHSLLSETVSRVTLPGTAGSFTVLKDHAPLISSLGKGEIIYASGEKEGRIQIGGGFAEVSGNKVTVCAEV